MKPTQIAALLTCHNRREKTLTCLGALFDQVLGKKINTQVYLVDCGSTDGTVEAVRDRFPRVKLLLQDDNLFWCGGMRLAFEEAMKGDFDYYLWLNDDNTLLPGAIHTLLHTAQEVQEHDGRDCMVVGSTRDPETGRRTYGGLVQPSKWRPLDFRPVEPSHEPQRCDTMNGNCVLIPQNIVRSLGNLSAEFTHAIGDTDYGLRARDKGFSLWVAPGYVGECSRNPLPAWVNPETYLKDRLKSLQSPKGLPPREWIAFTRRHTGLRWPIYLLKLRMRVFFPRLWIWLDRWLKGAR